MKKLLILVLITCLGVVGQVFAQGAFYERFERFFGDNPYMANGLLTEVPQAAVFTETRTSMLAPLDALDYYRARMTAWLTPTATGYYRFMVASDDNGRLWLSPDQDPAKATLIGYHDAWQGDQDWTETTNPERISSPIYLEAGRTYWIRAAMAEGSGGDNMSVGWHSPDAGINDWVVVPGSVLSPDHPFLQELDDGAVEYEAWAFTVPDNSLPGTTDLETAFGLGAPDDAGMFPLFHDAPGDALAPTDNENAFLLRERGVIWLDEAGPVGFATNSDDGSQLFIGPWWEEGAELVQVVNNNGGHGTQYRGGEIELPAGYVGITVTDCEGGGGNGLEVYYWTPSIPRTKLDSNVLIAEKKACIPSPSNGEWDVSTDAVLSWTAPWGATTPEYVVYFSEVGQALAKVAEGEALSYDPDLEEDTYYQWRVDVIEPNETPGGNPVTTTGTVWSFATTVPSFVTITSQPPMYVRADAGSDASVSVEATCGRPLTYQWKKDGEDIDGANDSTLVIADFSEEDNGSYTCVVSSGSSTITSDASDVQLKAQIAYYPLDSDLVDPTGAGPTGTYFANEGKELTFEAGVVGNAIAINIDAEYNEYVAFGAQYTLGIVGEAPRTIACWAKNAVAWDQMDEWQTIFGFTSPTGTSEHSFDFDRRGGQNQYCIHRYGAEWNMQEIDGNWHFLVASFDNDTIYWYVDGVYSGTATTNLQSQDILHLGKRAHSDALWRGWVDEARVFNYEITLEEVAALYAESGMTAAPSCPGNAPKPAMDFNGDCVVDGADVALFAEEWLDNNLAQ